LKRKYDVVIVGAGPAGATLAYELAGAGIGVLVLEKAKLPRYKCCAGGVTAKAAKLSGMNIDEIAEDIISTFTVTLAGDSPYQGDSDEPVMYTVRRENFDYALVDRAEKAGADVLQGVEALGIQFDDAGVEILTSAGSFYSQLIAGADGAESIVLKELGIKRKVDSIVGITSEVFVADRELAKWKSRILIDLGGISGGYGWVFPKADHLSTGFACPTKKGKGLKGRYSEFLASLDLGHYRVARSDSSLLPVCAGKTVVARSRAVLLGDAAGLASPLTGEGIYNAILSAQLAAPAIKKSLEIGKSCLDDYQKSVDKRIIPDMRIARVFSKVLALAPNRLFGLLKSDERVWRACCRMLLGEMDYSQAKSGIKALGILYDLVLRGRRKF
jgi:geranylgeranyl reductase family protein